MTSKVENGILTLKYDNSDIWMEFQKVDKIDAADNYGRTAIAWPTTDLKEVEQKVTDFRSVFNLN